MTFLRSLDYKQPPRGCGQVKAWSDYYGYGFIAPFCAGPDLFVHATEVHADPATGYRDLAVGEWVYYDLRVDDDGKAQAINVTGPDGAYVEGRRGGGIVIEEDDVAPTVTPKKKGVIRDFTESKYWSMEQAPRTRAPAEKVPDLPQPKVNWWED
jgi:cold shock CspA family protein